MLPRENNNEMFEQIDKKVSVELTQWFYRRINRNISAGRVHAALGSDERVGLPTMLRLTSTLHHVINVYKGSNCDVYLEMNVLIELYSE